MDPDDERQHKADYRRALREARADTPFGIAGIPIADAIGARRRRRRSAARALRGGVGTTAAASASGSPSTTCWSNERAERHRRRVRAREDPRHREGPEVGRAAVARTTTRSARKRLCVDTGYYETFNRDNVTLVDVAQRRRSSAITADGRARRAAASYEVDAIVFATGFDAMTGALLEIDIRGRDGARCSDKWEDGPRTYLGLTVAGFPNLFMVTGPGSPGVKSHMIRLDRAARRLDHLALHAAGCRGR